MSRVRSPKGRQAYKTLAIWTVLIATYSIVYGLLGGNPTRLAVTLSAAAGAVVFVVGLLLVVRASREMRRFHADNSAAVAALGRGELERARTMFWEWAEKATVSRIAAVARHNLAWTLARQGELAQAIEVAVATQEALLPELKAVALAPTSAVDLALFHALAGDLDQARGWLAAADERRTMLSLPAASAMRELAQAVVDCRSGNAADAARRLAEHWHEHEAILTGDVMRPLRVVRAFARSAAGPREAGVAEMDLVSARPAFPGEYALLAAGWPEMAAFLAAHELAA